MYGPVNLLTAHQGIQRILLYWNTFQVDLDIDSAQGSFIWRLCTQVHPMAVVFLANQIEHSEEVKEGKYVTIVPGFGESCR